MISSNIIFKLSQLQVQEFTMFMNRRVHNPALHTGSLKHILSDFINSRNTVLIFLISTLKRSKIFSVLLVASVLAAETALASWFPLRIGRRQSRATAHPASVTLQPQIHRV